MWPQITYTSILANSQPSAQQERDQPCRWVAGYPVLDLVEKIKLALIC